MKRMLGTIVLFVLLILTAVALQKIDTPAATIIGRTGNEHHAVE